MFDKSKKSPIASLGSLLLENMSKRTFLVAYVLFFSIITSIMFFSTTVALNQSLDVYSLTTFDLFYYIPTYAWIIVFALGGLLIFLTMNNLNGISQRFTYAIMLVSLLIIFVIFFGMPYLLEPLPRYWDVWIHGSAVRGILDTGHITSADFNYQGYPGSFIFISALAEISGIDLVSLLHILPVIMVIAFFLFLVYCINEITANPKIAIIATLIYGLSTYYLLFHFSPEIFGWLLFFVIVALLAKQAQLNKQVLQSSRLYLVIFLFILLAVGMTHPVTQAIVLIVTFFLFIFRKRIWLSRGKMTLSLILLATVVFVAWAMFFGTQYYSNVIQSFNAAYKTVLSDLSSSTATSHYTSANIPGAVNSLLPYRRALYVLVPVMAVLGLLFFRNKEKPKSSFLVAMTLAGVLMASLTIFGILPVERSIKLAFIPLSVLAAIFIAGKRKVGIGILVFLVATMPLNFAVYYWDEPFSMTHNWQISSAEFIAENYHNNVLCDYHDALIMTYYNGTFTGVVTANYLVGTPRDIYNSTFIYSNRIGLVYLSDLSSLKMEIAGNPIDKNFTTTLNFDCISSDSHSVILFDPRLPSYVSPNNP